MSTEILKSQNASLASIAFENISKDRDITTPAETPTAEEEKERYTSKSSIYSPANLLSRLLSPFFSSGTSSEPITTTSPNNDQEKEKEKEKETTKSPTKISIEAPISDSTQSTPEPYYTSEETPLYKTLYKTRLTKIRTKQLLRAGDRAYNDPPPPPGLGDCCGSSCDPCVRDLWKQEIGIWRERWGDRGVEEGTGGVKDEKKSVEKEKLAKMKELEW
ncbi:Oxidoreductase-like, N-terminal [Penicillium italicum]|uniref:Oxidoreductase-like, N-terminal n=1 Tax=Penicillium italicum TaxID=40296 RepID=A0A0A2KLZ1_PENIT|nr:Oxidoreductase-like, N-terminal [Penicillium italicum]